MFQHKLRLIFTLDLKVDIVVYGVCYFSYGEPLCHFAQRRIVGTLIKVCMFVLAPGLQSF